MIYIYIYIYIYIGASPAAALSHAAAAAEGAGALSGPEMGTVSFHNFKSQNFKSSVSNPNSKYVAYVSVLSQISDSQGLGRKNNFEILKTYCKPRWAS